MTELIQLFDTLVAALTDPLTKEERGQIKKGMNEVMQKTSILKAYITAARECLWADPDFAKSLLDRAGKLLDDNIPPVTPVPPLATPANGTKFCKSGAQCLTGGRFFPHNAKQVYCCHRCGSADYHRNHPKLNLETK